MEDSHLLYYTLSSKEKIGLPDPFKGGMAEKEITLFIDKGADALFIEFPHFTQNFVNSLAQDDEKEGSFSFAP